jgi:hypothetical protein
MRTDQLERIAILEAGGTVLVNVRKGHDEELITWASSTGRYVYIGDREPHTGREQSEWYNPFKVAIYGRAEAIRLYRAYILMRTDLLARLRELRGKVLGCWCYPKSCHGDVLIELLREGGER